MKIVDTEVNGVSKVPTIQEYQYEKELKFIVFNLAMELKCFFIIFCSKEFMKHLQPNENLTRVYEKIREQQRRFNDYQENNNNSNNENEEKTLRIFQSQTKEIKFTPYFLQKMGEKHGVKILKIISLSLDIYIGLLDYIIDIGYVIQDININKVGAQIL